VPVDWSLAVEADPLGDAYLLELLGGTSALGARLGPRMLSTLAVAVE